MVNHQKSTPRKTARLKASTYRLPKPLLNRLEDYAESEGKSKVAVITLAVEQLLDRVAPKGK